ncbi:hypothetical protein [Mucilaginibacter sp. SJ]|uniref:hypothetical protein n=1 Tax=Mucilaginibacter sp. SJ TaxID=3029053 RepID=UPI0023A95006|nr:hypothetical protein [Mucilaginibacter sp. SJ]WEA01907.1 hypothetical protein MusilaSJ_03085 [Mucilaginibacter sp. SJ]
MEYNIALFNNLDSSDIGDEISNSLYQRISGLGGKPYRDRSYEYYFSEKVITNDAKGIGAFIFSQR